MTLTYTLIRICLTNLDLILDSYRFDNREVPRATESYRELPRATESYRESYRDLTLVKVRCRYIIDPSLHSRSSL